MRKRTYTYLVHKDDSGNIVSIDHIKKNTKDKIIVTSEKYLDFEHLPMSGMDAIDMLIPVFIFLAWIGITMGVVIGLL